MVINFYNMTSPSIKIEKTLGNPVKTTAAAPNPDGPIDVVNPVLFVDAAEIPSNANYAVVEEPLNRAYFITSITYNTAKTAAVALHSDVLSNFAGSLGELNFIRGAGTLTEMEDAAYPISDYMVEEYYSFSDTWDSNFFSSGNTDRQYLLRTACNPDTPFATQVSLNDNQYFWAYPHKYVQVKDDGTEIVKYHCFKSLNPGKDYEPEMFYADDITHYTQVSDGDYVITGGNAYEWYYSAAHPTTSSKMIFKGTQ